MKILQANMHRSKIADSLMAHIALEKEADVVLISEHYRKISRGTWIENKAGTAAIWLPPSDGPFAISQGSGNGFAWVKERKEIYKL